MEQKYKNEKFGLEASNLELVNFNNELKNKMNLLDMCLKIQDKRIKGLNDDLATYKEKYDVALKAILELENVIDKGHYIKKCCKK
jgi:hypothetical protein